MCLTFIKNKHTFVTKMAKNSPHLGTSRISMICNTPYEIVVVIDISHSTTSVYPTPAM